MASYIGNPPAQTIELADNEVTTAKINDSAVTTAKVNDNAVTLAKLSATGTKDNTTFLRGDNTFQVVSTDLVADTTPQLGGNLDTNDKNIVTASNRDLNLYPNGTGAVEIGGNTNPGTIILNCEANSHGIKLQSPAHSSGQSYTLKFPTGNVTPDTFLKVASITGSGATAVGQLSFAEVSTDLSSDTTPQLGGNLDVNNQDIVSTSNADIDIIPNGTGKTNFGGTNGIVIPSGTTAQRVNTTGVLRFNTTTGLAEYFDGTAYKSLDSAPTVSSVSPTEVDRLGGGNQTVVITGSGFGSGATVTFVGNAGTNFNAASATVDSTTQITAVAPKTSFLNAQEPYGVKVENASGLSGTLGSQINVDTDVSWTTSAGSLGSIQDASTGTHFTVVATDTDGDTITYSITAGSLPGGLSLNTATGAISGDPNDVTGDTTSTFTLRASTSNSTADREFSITVTTSPYSADFLVIAGGGGGGTGQFGDQGGGGGAGGYRNSFNSESSGGNSSSESALTFNPGTVYTVTVGSGGGSSSQGNTSSLSGSDISTVSSVGGGRGATSNGSQQGQNGGNGGSGGGACAADLTKSGGSATSGQGSNGGSRSGWNNHSSAGGGGAGQTGGTASGGTGGNGGNGLSSSISGSSVTRGGGGGGTNNGGPGRSGGSGGGGTGRNGSNGTANTGGGGGGARSGGSGVVILRVPTVSYSGTTSGSPSVSTSGSDTIMVFNSSGSYTG